MAHDNDSGKIELRADRPRIYWPNVGYQPVFKVVRRSSELPAC
jgi:hypothetical protein